MDSKKIKALIEVVDCGSITSAAEKLGYTQPGLTNMMNSLENELGLALLVRSKTGVSLTMDGWELLPSFKRLIAADEELSSYAMRLKEKNSSTLRVGAYSSASSRWVPKILTKFRALYIGTDTSMSSSDISLTYDAVKNGAVDCAIVSREPELMKGLAWIPLKKDELVAVLPNDYVTDEASFPVSGFNEEEFLMPSGGFEMNILPALSPEGHSPTTAHIRYTNIDDSAIVSMVEHNLGLSILSRLVLETVRGNVRILPLSPPAYREMGIIVRKERENEKNISYFIKLAVETVEAMYSGEE